ncbi:MAG: hypothetical protein WCS96_05060 [Victivallales bacterium]
MKNVLLIFGLCLMFCGCGEDAPPSKSDSCTPPAFRKNEPVAGAPVRPTTAKATPSGTAKTAAATPEKDTKNTGKSVSTQIIGDAAAVVDYGTGATPLTIKESQADKIQSVQDQRNQSTQKALNEK